MTTTAIKNGRILIGDNFVEGKTVVIRDGVILRVTSSTLFSGFTDQTVDLNGGFLAPGFIDIQVNGGGDRLFNDDPSIDTLSCIAEAHRRFGTTGFLATLISTDAATMRAAVAAVEQAMRDSLPGLLGIHFEGPLLASARKGVHDDRCFQDMSSDLMEIICSLKRGITLVTLAPEEVSPDSIRELSARGVIVFAGHSNADYETTSDALSAGVSGFTHLFNAMSPLESRAPGVVGAALSDPDCYVGIIADGHHVHWANLQIALLAKRRGKCVLVTDAMPPVGGTNRQFELGEKLITCDNGRCTTSDGTLAGSCLDMASAVRSCRNHLNVTLAEACRMASTYPAKLLGMGNSLGQIEENFCADLVAFDDDLRITRVWSRGMVTCLH